MSRLRRYYKRGDTVFVTAVTYERKPLLIDNVDLLLQAIASVQMNCPIEIIAQVVLPDHWHVVLNSDGSNAISSIIQRIKMSFGATYRKRHGRHSGRVWQRRYWDHIIRDENDLNTHIDYIHYNPVRHGLVNEPFTWKQSSIHRSEFKEIYPSDWGVKEPVRFETATFGE